MFRATARALGVAARSLRRIVLLAALALLIAVPGQAGFATPAFVDEPEGPWAGRPEEKLRPPLSGAYGPRNGSTTDVLRTISIDPSDRCPVYVGIAFDGRELLVGCVTNNVLTRVSPADGRNLGSVTIHGIPPSEGIAGMSWDANHRLLWIGTANVSPHKVYSAQLDSPGGAGFATLRFTLPSSVTGRFMNILDGVAYDGSDDSLWLKSDLATRVDRYSLTGERRSSFNVVMSSGFGAAGLVVASRDTLYLNDYFYTTEAIRKDGSRRSAFINFGDRRAEDIECDNVTFAPRKAVWGKVDYTLELHAWEVPECAQGGQVPGGIVQPPTPTPPPAPPSLTISPNPVPAGSSRTTISWNTNDGTQAQIFVSEDGGPESLVANGNVGSGEWPYVFPGNIYDFRLYKGTEHRTVLRSARVTRSPSSAACQPRPRVAVATVSAGSGLQATVTATGTGNRLLGLRFGAATNARISTDDRTNAAGDFTFAPPAGSVATTFSLQPVGPGSSMVPITAIDECGAWQTFVGRGSGG